MRVGDVCTRHIEVIHKSEGVLAAARQMREAHVGTLVVVVDSGGRHVPVGILTDRDIVVGIVAKDGDHVNMLTVGDVVTTKLVAAQESDDLEDVLDRMRAHGIRRMPIVDGRGTLVGILSFDDLVNHVAHELSLLTKLLARERRREERQRT